MAESTGLRSLGREVAGWVMLAGVILACFVFFTDIQALTRRVSGLGPVQDAPEVVEATPPADAFSRTVTLKAAENGHFFSTIIVNGREVEVIVDTGATAVALSYEDAEALGISVTDSDFTHVSQTANGESRVAPITIDEINLGDITVRNVDGFVTEPGKLFQTLLGMTFLSRLSRVDIRGTELVLEQ
jgi:aspartyl protease family protein